MLWLVDAHCTYQAGLDVEQLAAEGFSGLLVKATQGGTGYMAPSTFDAWIRRARTVGMVAGAYHWLTSASATSQVDHYLRRLDKVGGPEGLLCAVDVEDTSTPPSRATVEGFCERFAEKTGGHPLLLYTGAWWWTPRAWTGVTLTPYLWASRYVSGSGYASTLYTKVPASWWTPGYGGWPTVTLLQFSSSARAGGRTCDVNAYRGSPAELRALTTAKGTIMPWDQDIDVSRYQDLLPDLSDTMKAGTLLSAIYGNLRVSANQAAAAVAAAEVRDNGLAAMITNLGSGQYQLSDEQLAILRMGLADEIRAGLVEETAAAVVSLLAPQLRMVAQVAQRLGDAGDAVAQVAQRLGDAGDALGALNDSEVE